MILIVFKALGKFYLLGHSKTNRIILLSRGNFFDEMIVIDYIFEFPFIMFYVGKTSCRIRN